MTLAIEVQISDGVASLFVSDRQTRQEYQDFLDEEGGIEEGDILVFATFECVDLSAYALRAIALTAAEERSIGRKLEELLLLAFNLGRETERERNNK